MLKIDTRLMAGLALGAAVLMSGCATLNSGPPLLADDQPGVLEPVYAAAVTADTAIIRVSSNGCTTKSDLHPYLTHDGATTEMTVRRLRHDVCGTPIEAGVELRWTFEELGLPQGATLMVNNPYRLRDIVVNRRRGQA